MSITSPSRANIKYKYADYICLDGFKGRLGDSSSCKTYKQWQKQAESVCRKHPSCPKDCVKENESISLTLGNLEQECCAGLVLCPPPQRVLGSRGTCQKRCEVLFTPSITPSLK